MAVKYENQNTGRYSLTPYKLQFPLTALVEKDWFYDIDNKG